MWKMLASSIATIEASMFLGKTKRTLMVVNVWEVSNGTPVLKNVLSLAKPMRRLLQLEKKEQ